MMGFLKEKTALVTGGTGSLGSQVVRQLLEYDIGQVIVFSRDEIKQFIMQKMLKDEKIKFFVGDIRDCGSLHRVFSKNKIDIVYHTAAMKHVPICEANPIEAVMTNIIGTQNVVDVAKRNGIEKLITISTDKAVNPINVMGATK